jgi:hypothetical protein
MIEHAILDRSPMLVFYKSLHGGLAPGEMGAVVGRAGVGKSTLLVHIALDRLLRGKKVLHVSLSNDAHHVRSFYDEIFSMLVRASRAQHREHLALLVERGRLIHAYRGGDFRADALAKALDMDNEVMAFKPDVVILDAMPDAEALAEFAALAGERGFGLWVAGQTHRDEGGVFHRSSEFSTVVRLDANDLGVRMHAVKVHGEQPSPDDEMGLELDPVTMLVVGEDVWDPATGPWSPRPQECTLYSGGARGAEEAFGAQAEAWGCVETNFSFSGHEQARDRNRQELSESELRAGDVSLKYVSHKLNRRFAEGSLIRRVLQTIWHQVSRAQQVFVVGVIQDDGTVHGGTGWSVELARMWHKNLWVFDQEKLAWFRWTGARWNRGLPVIVSPYFCGTGTRNLRPESKAAITALYERSFGLDEQMMTDEVYRTGELPAL